MPGTLTDGSVVFFPVSADADGLPDGEAVLDGVAVLDEDAAPEGDAGPDGAALPLAGPPRATGRSATRGHRLSTWIVAARSPGTVPGS